MLNMLPKDSNIKQFAKHFSIIGACNDSEQAKENLFDYGKHNLPCKPTALQRIAKEHRDFYTISYLKRLLKKAMKGDTI